MILIARARVAAATVPALALAVVLAPAAVAVAPEAHGWWWRAQAGLLVPVPAPPQVPEDGLYVEGAPDGPSAISALRLRVPDDSVPVALVLTVAQEQGGESALLLACPAGGPWLPTSAGRWDARPPADCEGQGVVGQRAEDGSTWTFPLGLQSFTGTKDFVLVPGRDESRPAGLDGSVFSLAFQPPDEHTLVTEAADMHEEEEVRPPVILPPYDGGTVVPPFDPGTGTGTPTSPPAPDTAPEDPSVLTPRVTPPRGPSEGRPVSAGKDARALATLIALLSVGVAGVLSRDRLVGAAGPLSTRDAAAGEERLGGVGRFRRPRSSPPPPL